MPTSKKKLPIRFENKLLRLLSDDNYYIKWNTEGNGFIILNEESFITYISPTVFKIKSFQGFLRLLRKYGFTLTKIVIDCKSCYEFKHPLFIKKQDNITESLLYTENHHVILEKRLEEIKSENSNLKKIILERVQDIVKLKEKCQTLENRINEIQSKSILANVFSHPSK